MTIVTKNPHTWFTAESDSGEKQVIYNDEHYLHNYLIGFEVPFSDSSTPAEETVTLHNMSKEHREFYEKKQHCTLAFDWGESKKTIGEGYIKKISHQETDGVTESFTITFTEGTSYQNVSARKLKYKKSKKVNHYKTVKKTVPGHYETKRVHYYAMEDGKKVGHYRQEKVYVKAKTTNKRVKTRATKTTFVNKTYKKGTTYKKIIQGVISQSGIVVSKIQLAKNPKMKKAFTARGKPLTLLKKLVKPTGSVLEYIDGNLEIVNPKATKRTWIVIDDKDLIVPPSYNEDADDSDSDEKNGGYEITIPLDPEVHLNSGLILKSKYLEGKFYVKAGKHSSDGSDPRTIMTAMPL